MTAPTRARLALLAVALLAALGWRLELEYRGWHGLVWITYCHYAIPVGALLFAAWLYRYAPVRRPAVLALGSLLLTAAAYHGLYVALHILYSRWPLDQYVYAFGYLCGFAALFLYPLTHWGLARLLGHRPRLWPTLAAFALYLAAIPLTLTLLDAIGQTSSDLLHAIKSGLVIPPLILTLGWPLAPHRADPP